MSGEVYPGYIEGELKTERERRANLDARGAAVVTQSGGLLALMTGIAAFVKRAVPEALPPFAAIALVLALVFFFCAAVCGILVNLPHLYRAHPVGDEVTMKKMLNEKREQPDEEARSVVSSIHVGTMATLRKGNDRKVKFVSAAQICQIFALAAVSAAVFVEIVRA